ncbi:MAG TPA: sigma-70 family RNA polymerase sigma factor [Kofleriaceae bacterium]|nr:sigma-70 family RNA polymerase sigma factor [Kofleriaceae bacterium]
MTRDVIARTLGAHLVDDVIAALDHARAAWPTLAVSDDAMASAIARAIDDLTTFDKLFVDDLYFAQACVAGVPAATAELDKLIVATVTSSLRGMGLPEDTVADVLQDVRAKLLVDDRGAAKLATYSARAPLKSWVRTVATRVAVDRMRRTVPVAADGDELIEASATVDSPELELFRRKYHAEFKQAFEQAVASLDVRERNCLRHFFVDGLTTEEIGALYGVHKSTASRWIDAARTALTKRTRNNFQQISKLSTVEVDSIMRLLRSQIDLSLSRNLAA